MCDEIRQKLFRLIDDVYRFRSCIFGCVLGGFTRRFKGILDELRVYDRALSHPEIKNLYRLYPVEAAETDCAS